MPIKRENKQRYPSNWKQIVASIKERADHRCEWCGAENYQPHPVTGSRVVLTTAHLNPPIEDVRPENLASLCQRCHLSYDRKHHLAVQKVNREARRRQRQPVLFEE